MSEINTSKFLGEQLTYYRKRKGLTQGKLAELMHTTPQTISNYERLGIKDTDVEGEISHALGVNLREKPADKEGTVGEVGKEILFILLEHNGQISFEELSHNLFGMSEARIVHEIDKVADFDMCTREKYIGFDGVEKDIVYITAKGIITYKNLVSDEYHSSKLKALLPKVSSYEKLLRPMGGYEADLVIARDMEEYVNMRPWISEILKLSLTTTYKADYISYLYQNGANRVPQPRIDMMTDSRIFYPGVSFYHDLIYRMAYGFDDNWRTNYYFKLLDKKWVDRSDEVFTAVNGDEEDEDEVVSGTLWKFKKEFSWVSEDGKRGTMHPFSKIDEPEQQEELLEEYDTYQKISLAVYGFEEGEQDREERYNDHAPQGMENTYPDKWFSKEQIETFIRENYHAPRNEEEMRIQKQIEKIEKLRPRLKEYYSFPKEWEENGLADLVRKLCCI